MKNIRRSPLFWFLLVVTGCCVWAFVWLRNQFGGLFEDKYDIYQDIESQSPDKKKVATEYTISGGGAAGYLLSRVQLRPANQKFHTTKESDDFVFEIRHGAVLDMAWKSNKQLVVTYEKGGDVYRTSSTQGDIHISYVMKP